jgi:hypothetical protein
MSAVECLNNWRAKSVLLDWSKPASSAIVGNPEEIVIVSAAKDKSDLVNVFMADSILKFCGSAQTQYYALAKGLTGEKSTKKSSKPHHSPNGFPS